MINKTSILFIICCITTLSLQAFNLKKKNIELRGSVINSMYQNDQGIMWFGTNAGISHYDGTSSTLLTSFRNINSIHGTKQGEMITDTLYGLKIYDEKTDSISTFDELKNILFTTSNSSGTVFIMQKNGSVYYKTNKQTEFNNLIITGLESKRIKLFSIDDTDKLRIISTDGVLRSFEISEQQGKIYFREKPAIKIATSAIFCFEDNNFIYLIDDEYKLYKSNPQEDDTKLTLDLRQILSDKGKITTAIVFRNEFYFGTESGLYYINENNSTETLVQVGITCLLKDKYQDLIWIGTAGDGVYTYFYDLYTIKSQLISDFAPSASPITAIHLSATGSLWLGTQDDGIITIPNYNPNNKITNTRILSTKDGLPDNSIRTLQKSRLGIWIGSKSGLSFFSNKHKTITKISNIELDDVQAVYEQGTYLWLACYEKGIVKVNIIFKDEKPEVLGTKLYVVNNGDKASNRFSSICSIQGNLLFVNKGNSIFTLNDNKLFKLTADKFNSISHIEAICETEYIAAADFGTLRFSLNNQSVTSDTLLSDMAARAVIARDKNDFWLSTDNGLAVYNTQLNTFRYLDDSYGLTITEYNDGVSYNDVQNDIIFFGGINGFTTIQHNLHNDRMDCMPVLHLANISLFGVNRFVSDFKSKESNNITFNSDENVFSLTFNALDYINGRNYIYYYKIGENGQWINNGNSEIISFTNIKDGNYNLFVKYYNTMHNKESQIQTFQITVLPPWYRTMYAYAIYLLLSSASILLIINTIQRRRKRIENEKSIKAEQDRREEITEAKLDFFTDIAHELCTPLTLINGPCKRILEQKTITPSITKYVNLIGRNANRMSSLIRNLMNFKLIEAGQKKPNVKRINISEIADSIVDIFRIDVSGSKIDIVKQYYAGIMWNSDETFIETILTNLVSNAVKYSQGGTITINISTKYEILVIKVSNKGQGIAKEDLDRIFDKYTILKSSEHRLGWQQNGLGLAITAGMIELLDGNVTAESISNELTTFIVSLPEIPVSEIQSLADSSPISEMKANRTSLPSARYTHKDDWQTVTVIDDDLEMLWFICDVLNDEFNVISINNPKLVMETLAGSNTDIILCDVMMEGLNGIELSKLLKADMSTSHIPLIMLSSVHEVETKTEAIDAGAELYITKPFNTDYLKTSIKRLLGRKEDLKDYFASPLSAYEQNMGKLQHTEHRKFIRKIASIITKNIQNQELSPNFIALQLGISTRSLYRKLKEITDVGLQDMIRDGKLNAAENLLVKSKLTIDEIVYESGFTNRASFYRAFTKKHGCSPTEFAKKIKN